MSIRMLLVALLALTLPLASHAAETDDGNNAALVEPAAVPEPASLLLFGTGLIAVARVARRRARA